MTVNEKEYSVVSLLGKGKGGYSYLVTDGKQEYVLKQIHHEPCDYYQFGDKLQSELNDYERLLRIGIPMPKLLDADREKERILKEYISGDTIFSLVKQDRMEADFFHPDCLVFTAAIISLSSLRCSAMNSLFRVLICFF